MSITALIFLSIALGMDCLVVSFSQGLIFTSQRTKNSLALAFTMGLFQGLMPVIGYAGADIIHKYVESYSQWLVFGIFLILGLKFILEAFQDKEDDICCIGLKCLLGMGFATSIDALVAGASLNFTRTPLMLAAFIIGTGSFLMSLSGFWFGNFFKKFPAKYLETTGGIILIILAVKAVL